MISHAVWSLRKHAVEKYFLIILQSPRLYWKWKVWIASWSWSRWNLHEKKGKVFECSTKWSCLSCHLKCEIPERWMGKVAWKDAVFHESRNEPARGKFWKASHKCRASLNSDPFKESKNISEGRIPKGNWSEQQPKVFLSESEVLSQFQEKWSSTWSLFYHVHCLSPSHTCQLFAQSWQSRIL